MKLKAEQSESISENLEFSIVSLNFERSSGVDWCDKEDKFEPIFEIIKTSNAAPDPGSAAYKK